MRVLYVELTACASPFRLLQGARIAQIDDQLPADKARWFLAVQAGRAVMTAREHELMTEVEGLFAALGNAREEEERCIERETSRGRSGVRGQDQNGAAGRRRGGRGGGRREHGRQHLDGDERVYSEDGDGNGDDEDEDEDVVEDVDGGEGEEDHVDQPGRRDRQSGARKRQRERQLRDDALHHLERHTMRTAVWEERFRERLRFQARCDELERSMGRPRY